MRQIPEFFLYLPQRQILEDFFFFSLPESQTNRLIDKPHQDILQLKHLAGLHAHV